MSRPSDQNHFPNQTKTNQTDSSAITSEPTIPGAELLGQSTEYASHYDPTLLKQISRLTLRDQLTNTAHEIAQYGFDFWNAYEFSWLNRVGIPQVGLLTLQVPSNSPCLFESKSAKLYLGAFHATQFDSEEAVTDVLSRDLSAIAEAPVTVSLSSLREDARRSIRSLEGICLDALQIDAPNYHFNPAAHQQLLQRPVDSGGTSPQSS